MPVKQTKDHVIRKCPECGVRNRISLDPLPKRIRCGECKEELALPRRIKAKPVEAKQIPSEVSPRPQRQADSIAKGKAAAAVKAASAKTASAKRIPARKSSQRDSKIQMAVTKKAKARNPAPARVEDEAVIVTESAFLTQTKTAITEVSGSIS